MLAVSEAGGAKWAQFVCVSFMGSPRVQGGIGQCQVQSPVTHWVQSMAATNQEHNEGWGEGSADLLGHLSGL